MRDAPNLISQLDLNLLYTYLLVVDAGGVGRAALALGRSQPAVTLRLRQLEEALGAKLLTRAGRGVAPTMLGRALIPEIRRIVEHARRVVDLTRAEASEAQGTFRIGVLPMLGVHLLAPALAELAPELPRVDFELFPGFIDEALDDLAGGRIDLALTVGDLAGRDAETRLQRDAIGEVRAVLVFPKGLLPARAVTAKTLARFDLVGYGDVKDPFFDAVTAFLAERSLISRVRVRVSHIQTLKALVRAGLGVAIIPDYTAPDPELGSARVVGLEVAQPISALMRPELRRMAVAQRLIAVLRRRSGG